MILAINRGSSSIKFAVYPAGDQGPAFSGKLERIGLPESVFEAREGGHTVLMDQRLSLPTHEAALKTLLDWLGARKLELRGVGHRIVHGGMRFDRPQLVTPDVIAELKRLVPLAPEHMPQEIEAIEAVGRLHPSLPQVVCFDTSFHRKMPRIAQLYGLPRQLADQGVIRYGFHGLSYEYIAGAMPHGRVIAAHLGNGASLTAIRDGASIDTSMGFTPTGGIPMGTRSGDVDPAVILYLLREKNFSAAGLGELVNEKSGLLGLSGLSADMQDLLGAEQANPAAAEAIGVFCYQVRKYIGAFTAALDGLDTLVFAGGMGENAAPIRQRICEQLGSLGISLDEAANAHNAEVISTPQSKVLVRVIRTNEELMVARHARDVLTAS